ncbi:Myotubularin- protein 9 [Clonorchis sinensis]|uniref:Myotubularin- protein 9 n=2 Tax=Clonorchis sinensis TaxID=79923 RepID=A0A8T1MKJ9_CLOSI|nr:Myotubularin- protein 9 [Clonorchis sinensis]GAA47722.1 myotubularin-related protein 9 [Clonorchis sinensis]
MELASLIRVNNINGCRLCGPHFSIVSKKLALTNHQLLFISDGEDFSLPYKAIDGVRLLDTVAERRYPQSGLNGHTLSLQTKSFCIYELTVLNGNEARALLCSIEALASVDVGLQYPFFYGATFPDAQNKFAAIDSRSDLAEALATEKWRVSRANENYSICSSYACDTIVPTGITDDLIRESAGFRRGGRFPTLVYYHVPRHTALLISSEPVFQSPTSYPAVNLTTTASKSSSVVGSPQHATLGGAPVLSPNSSSAPVPSIGSATGNRCRADEQLLAAILPDRYRGAILDVRDQPNVKKNTSQVVAAESEPNYPQWRRICRSMEAPAQVNTVFRKLIEVCLAPGRSTRSGTSSLGAFTTGALTDSLNALATVAMGPSGAIVPSDSSNGEGASRAFWDSDGDSMDRFPAPEVSSTTVATNPQMAHNMRRIGAWLTVVREALAAAVAGATALDARDAFAQQQLQQEQLILTRNYKDQQVKSARTQKPHAVREEAKLRGSFVLVQSRHGYDRALVVAGLIQVILNPAARTLSGFPALIEHTWIRSGHPFSERYRNACLGPRNQKTQAPIFLLFLDGVWQLWRQYPNAFEFTDELLCFLAQHVYYSEFGTFLGSTPKDREELKVDERTTSLWVYLEQPSVLANFKNPLYCADKDRDTTNYACWPCLAPQALELWREVYLKQQYTELEPIWAKPRQLNRLIKEQFFAELEKTRHLRKLLNSLQQEARSAGLLTKASKT